jgi:hypothetical protein
MMRKRVRDVLGAAFVAAMSVSGAVAESGRWLHVRVVDRGQGQETVRINLPVAVLETMATSIEAERMKDGRVQIGDSGLTPAQFRQMWLSLRNAGDMEFVTIDSGNETVKVARSGGFMLARIRGGRDGEKGAEKVDLKVPINVVDALLDAPEGELNFKAALQRLAAYDGGDLVTIQDSDSDVRIWIDSQSETD